MEGSWQKLILSRGWNTIITARNTDQVKDLAEGYENTALVLPLDVTKKEQVSSAVAKAEETFGKIDVLVNNAGYGYFTSIEQGEEDKIRGVILTPPFFLLKL